MKRTFFLFVVLGIGIIINQFTGYNFAYLIEKENKTGKVIKIYDGDTITILSGGKKFNIRLYGIDAPERAQSFGIESRNHLIEMCPIMSDVEVKVKDIDRYKRLVGIVFCNDVDVNAKQVEYGYAWAYNQYSLAYSHLEMIARFNSWGLWKEKNPINPSDFRKGSK